MNILLGKVSMKKNNILVVVEQNNNKIADVSLELICKAREIAQQLNVSVDAIVIGHKMHGELKFLGFYGCENIYHINDHRLMHFTSVPYAKIITNNIKKYQPQIVLFGATSNGRDISPRVASALKCGLTADCTDLQIGDYEFKGKTWKNTLLQIRPAFGGNIVATIVSPESSPSMATVREGVIKMTEPDYTKKINIIEEKCDLLDSDFLTEIIEITREERAVDLKGAKIIVAAGIGAANKEAVTLVKELAKTLGAEIGCTRPVVDAGLLTWEYQIGQTGLTVRPNLFIACGISGQLQHTTGMEESKRIIAINTDPNAPIFKLAHYGIVGDLNDIIPKMIKAYKTKA